MLIMVHYKYILSTIISQYIKHNKPPFIGYIQQIIKKIQKIHHFPINGIRFMFLIH